MVLHSTSWNGFLIFIYDSSENNSFMSKDIMVEKIKLIKNKFFQLTLYLICFNKRHCLRF